MTNNTTMSVRWNTMTIVSESMLTHRSFLTLRMSSESGVTIIIVIVPNSLCITVNNQLGIGLSIQYLIDDLWTIFLMIYCTTDRGGCSSRVTAAWSRSRSPKTSIFSLLKHDDFLLWWWWHGELRRSLFRYLEWE